MAHDKRRDFFQCIMFPGITRLSQMPIVHRSDSMYTGDPWAANGANQRASLPLLDSVCLQARS